jgi:hypothetical protein
MADFQQTMADAEPLSEADQKKAGKPIGDDMGDEHKNFVKIVSKLLDSGEIDVTKPETFLKKDVYDALDADSKAKIDIAMLNMATLLSHIYYFYKSKKTPDAAPQLETMIEQLWQMKQRIESHADVFKF